MAALSASQVIAYRRDGFVQLEQAFSRGLALRCRELLWNQLDEDVNDATTWHRPVVRIESQSSTSFREVMTARLVEAIQQVAGPQADPPPWMGGTIAVRFPIEGDPGDDGWHIDGSYLGPDGGWWANHWSKDRALLMLVLLSDVGADDAPTRIRVGSHADVPAALLPYGDDGINTLTLQLPSSVGRRPMAFATGNAGDVYLCHPFLVHAAQRHRGHEPRFVAQPGVPWKQARKRRTRALRGRHAVGLVVHLLTLPLRTRWRIQSVGATSRASACDGFIQPRVCRGRLLSL